MKDTLKYYSSYLNLSLNENLMDSNNYYKIKIYYNDFFKNIKDKYYNIINIDNEKLNIDEIKLKEIYENLLKIVDLCQHNIFDDDSNNIIITNIKFNN